MLDHHTTRRGRSYRFWRGALLGAAITWAAMALPGPADPAPADFMGTYVGPAPAAGLPASAPPVDVRTGCRIGAFGVAPWRPQGHAMDASWASATRAALRHMGLPDEAATEAIQRLRAGRADMVIGMRNTHGVASVGEALFYPTYTTTYRASERYTVCHDSATRFANDTRQEYATVHKIEHLGAVYWVGEFLACGNVSRFIPAPLGWNPRPRADLPAAASAPAGASGPAVWPPWAWPQPGGGDSASRVLPVPEPSTWVLVLLGVVLIWLFRKRSK